MVMWLPLPSGGEDVRAERPEKETLSRRVQGGGRAEMCMRRNTTRHAGKRPAGLNREGKASSGTCVPTSVLDQFVTPDRWAICRAQRSNQHGYEVWNSTQSQWAAIECLPLESLPLGVSQDLLMSKSESGCRGLWEEVEVKSAPRRKCTHHPLPRPVFRAQQRGRPDHENDGDHPHE